ncbi:MAG: hypothetical protein AB1646_17165 [Thermodesulfobacteriota bacterium]
MKINCISCGHSFALDDAYEDFVGMVKCYVCGGLLDLKISDGRIQSVNLAVFPQRAQHGPEQDVRRE